MRTMQAIAELFDIKDSIGKHHVSVEVIVPDAKFGRFFPDIGVHEDYRQAALWAIDAAAKRLLAETSLHMRWSGELLAALLALAEQRKCLEGK